ncbi:MAG: hypothetical protein FJY98_02875 [Candidatus Liptonbacteria bacterium]|nr:hypothetical protein [Candidatus Liptonbacteria bacterium]
MKTRTLAEHLTGNGTIISAAAERAARCPKNAKAEFPSPNSWFAKQFPKIHAHYGNPIALKQNRDGDVRALRRYLGSLSYPI